jgi:hypothetical protein
VIFAASIATMRGVESESDYCGQIAPPPASVRSRSAADQIRLGDHFARFGIGTIDTTKVESVAELHLAALKELNAKARVTARSIPTSRNPLGPPPPHNRTLGVGADRAASVTGP